MRSPAWMRAGFWVLTVAVIYVVVALLDHSATRGLLSVAALSVALVVRWAIYRYRYEPKRPPIADWIRERRRAR